MSSRHIVHASAAAALVSSLAACTPLPVTTDSNPAMSVASCHTYAFAQEHVANSDQPAAYGNPLNAERLRVAIESNLAAGISGEILYVDGGYHTVGMSFPSESDAG